MIEEVVVAEIVTGETPVVPGDPTIDEAVDELFARIRAGRADEVANAEEVLAEPPADDAPADSLGAESLGTT